MYVIHTDQFTVAVLCCSATSLEQMTFAAALLAPQIDESRIGIAFKSQLQAVQGFGIAPGDKIIERRLRRRLDVQQELFQWKCLVQVGVAGHVAMFQMTQPDHNGGAHG